MLPLLLAVCILYACGQRTVYHTYQPVDAKGWIPSDTLVYEVEIGDSAITLEVSAEVRNRTNYSFRNLTLDVSFNFADTLQWEHRKANFILADEEGKWSGTGWGSLYTSTSCLGDVYVYRPGIYTIRIAHDMRTEILEGIQDVGIRLNICD